MTAKPSYEELERRVQELEIIESEYKHLMEVSQENESLFKRLYEKAPLGYQSLDENGHFLVVNPTWLDTLGYAKEEVIGKSFADFLHPDWRDHFKENFPRFKSIGEVLGVEFEMVKKNGDPILVSFTGKISRDKKGDFQQTHCIFHDITERKQAEEALQESEERYREIVELAVDGILQGSADGKIIGANSQMQKWLGRPLEQLLGLNVSELFDPAELKAKPLRFELLNLKQPLVNERNLRRSDGTSLPVEMHSKRMPDGTYQSIYRDITERKKAEEALRENEDLLNTTQRLSKVGGWEWNLEAQTMYWTEETYRIHEIAQGELEPGSAEHIKRGVECYEPEDRSVILAAFQRCVEEGQPYDLEAPFTTFKGQRLWVRTTARPVFESGKVIRVIGNIIDITERKQTESALKLVAESSLLSAHDIFPFLVRQIAVSQEMRYAFIARVDPSDYTAHTVTVWCGDRYGENFSYALEGTPCNNVASGGDVFYPANVQSLFPHDKLLVDMGIESYWGTALRTSTGELLGVMAIMHDQPIIETPQTHALLQAFALRTSVEMERQQTEELLRENQEDLKKAQHIAKLGNWHLDIKSNQLVWSDELYRMYGFDPTLPPPLYTDLIKLFTPESWEKLSTAMQQTKDTGIPYDLELETLRIDGSHGWMWAHGMAEVDATKEIIGLRGVAQDITERKQTEADLLAQREYLTDIIDSLPDATLIINTDQRVVVWNRAAEAMTGVKRDDLLGKGDNAYAIPFYGESRPMLIDLVNISDEERERSYTKVKRLDDKIYAETFIQTLNNGEGAYLWGVAAPLFDRTGLRTGTVEVIKDITVRKNSEKANIQLKEQLLQSQKMEAIGQLAGGVAHDFNNMLGVIIGYSELILEQMDPSQQFHADLVEIEKAARRSADLTRQLLTFARKQTVAPRVLDLNQTIEGMLNMLRRLIGENISLSWMPGFGLWPINMDPSQIDQILANLCVNGRDAIAGIGKLTVETKNASFDKEYCATHAGSLPGDYVRITVSDTGSGMDKETLAHIFEPFFTTKEVGEGTGLGLATVYGAVKQNNGYINAYSEPGQGTTFTIYIPRHVETTTETQVTASIEPVVRGDEIVMLVEDEPTLLQMSKTMLERLGYTVLAAGTPSEAIRLASEHPGQIQLLATDVVMPEMNGRQLSARLLESRPEMKCLFMSGYTANIIANQGVLKEGMSFIQKPFSKNELAIKVRAALES
jgi:PAS domain S-box-containing protein